MPIPVSDVLFHNIWLDSCATPCAKKLIMKEVLSLYRRHESNATSKGKLNVNIITDVEQFNDFKKFSDLIFVKTLFKKQMLNSICECLIVK